MKRLGSFLEYAFTCIRLKLLIILQNEYSFPLSPSGPVRALC